jgi:arylsulfatase A-like enzyme
VLSTPLPALGQVISVNFYHTNTTVGPTKLAGLIPVPGWNDVLVPGGSGPVNTSPGFSPVTLLDSTGAPAASISSDLSSHWNGDSQTVVTGLNGDLMTEFISWDTPLDGQSPDDTGTVTVSGLGSAFTDDGYSVYIYFDSIANDRDFAITIDGQTIVGSDRSTFNGILVEASGAGIDSNYAVFNGLTTSSFDIDLDSTPGRAAVNGLQIVSANHALPPATGPNIVLVLADDLGWQDVSEPFDTQPTVWNGLYVTPHLEALADSGIKFTQAYAASPICSPTRTSLMTGKNPGRTGVTDWVDEVGRSYSGSVILSAPWTSEGLQPGDGIPKLPEILAANGYLTAQIGKAHLGAEATPGADPTALGYHINVGGSHWGHLRHYTPDYGGYDRYPGLEAYDGTNVYMNDALTIEATRTIDHAIDAGMPFFIFLSHYAVHTPIDGEGDASLLPAYASRPNPEDDYAAMIESLDASLGNIIAHLQASGVADDTLVIFFSDNGGLTAFGRYDSPNPGDPWHQEEHNSPLRAGKGSAYDGGIRVPFVAAWAGQSPGAAPVNGALPIVPDSVSAEPVSSDDLFPTLLALAGVSDLNSYLVDLDGQDIRSLLDGSNEFARDDALFWHYPHQWIADVGDHPGVEPFTAMRQGRWKLIYFYADQRFELYDLDEDIGEVHDLAAERPSRVAVLGATLVDWMIDADVERPLDIDTLVELPLPVLPEAPVPGIPPIGVGMLAVVIMASGALTSRRSFGLD